MAPCITSMVMAIVISALAGEVFGQSEDPEHRQFSHELRTKRPIDFTHGAVVGITLGSVVMIVLLCAVIGFSIFLYRKHMCPCIHQEFYAPKPVEIHFNSYHKGPGANPYGNPYQNAEAISPWVSILIANANKKTKEEEETAEENEEQETKSKDGVY